MVNEFERNYLRYSQDPWAYMVECVYTQDQVDSNEPVKLFPNKKYLKILVRLWQKYRKLAIPKSRRMTASWTAMALYSWVMIFRRSQSIAFVSKKEEDADALTKRVKFILENIPENKIPKQFLPKFKYKFCRITADELNNEIMGFPQGADQLRQFTFSHIFGDEAAFWEKAKDFYAASLPTIDGGGSMMLVSSPAPGFFKKLVFDQINAINSAQIDTVIKDAKSPMQGTRVWINRLNKFLVYELHYTADPTKRSPEYKESIKASLPLQEYLREYELYWDTFEGAPVYPEFNTSVHINNEAAPVPGLPLLIGMDFGLTPAAVIGQYVGDTLYIFEEYVEVNMGAERFLETIVPSLRLKYSAWSDLKKDWFCFVDPSGFFRNQSDEGTCAREVAKYFAPKPGPVVWEDRRRAVTEFLLKLGRDGARLQVSEKKCPVLTQGFKGGYRYSENAIEVEPGKVRPVKDAHSHPHDALQYLCYGATQLVREYRSQVPKPEYSFMEGNRR